jgi:hypothetical protein
MSVPASGLGGNGIAVALMPTSGSPPAWRIDIFTPFSSAPLRFWGVFSSADAAGAFERIVWGISREKTGMPDSGLDGGVFGRGMSVGSGDEISV